MRLKSLEMIGFKSFPDKTVLNIENGMTVVVGPNGSGKSNISDAVRWVLGELSAKNVRGSKMEDVIFSGSNSRKPLNYAEVSLTIDNEEDAGSGRLNSEYSEVTVTRRCYRSGESEYQINRRNCRLKDISELFMNTGVGKTGYSIIGQGKIADIISQKSEERRVIFEEAAGISKYRYQKNDSERKLANVDDNLLRLNDIFAELSSRIDPLREESEKAKKYLDIYEKKKRADVSVSIFDIKRLRDEQKKAEEEFESAQQLYNIVESALEEMKNKSERLFEKNQGTKLEAERVRNEISDAKDREHAISEEIIRLEGESDHISSLISESEKDVLLKEASIDDFSKKISDKTLEKEEFENKISAASGEKDSVETKLDSLREKRSAIESDQALNKKKQEDNILAINDIKVKIASDESAHGSMNDRKEAIVGELESSKVTRELLSNRVEKAEKSVADYNRQIEEINKKTETDRAEAEGLSASLDSLENEIDTLVLEKRTKEQRIDNLKRMEELFEGFQFSVKSVMKAAESGRLSGIIGPVSKIINVKPKYATAIETALGAAVQNIVVDDEDSAKKAIEFLRGTNGGRATFYPLSSVSPKGDAISVPKGTAGYIGKASELIQYDDIYANVIDYLLLQTLVFDNLDNAISYSKKNGYRIKAVTLDGQQINAGGSFTGGSSRKDSGLLTRANEIESLKKAIASVEAEIEIKEKSKKELTDKLEKIQSSNRDAIERTAIFERLKNAEETQLQVIKSQFEIQDARDKELQLELDSLEENYKNAAKRIEEYNNNASEIDKEQEAIKEKLAALDVEHEAVSKEIFKLSSSQSSISVEIVSLNKDVEIAQNTINLYKDQQEALRREIITIREENEKRRASIAAHTEKKQSLAGEKESVSKKIVESENELLAFNNEAVKQDASIASLRQKINDQTTVRDNLYKEYSRLENRKNNQTAEIDRLTSRLWEDYELTYSSACELQYPEVTEETRKKAVSEQNELRTQLKALGNVNTGAIEEYDSVCKRHQFLSEQISDLEKSKAELLNIIADLEREMCVKFVDTIDALNVSFNNVFTELFGGGKAELKLTDPADVLNCGIEINVAPPGKIIKSLSLLSGGEQSFVAIALLFAILNINPTPFCILDEIEAALDEVNVARFAEYARRYSSKTQFIIITHRRGSMERGDRIYGVTMPQRGISKVISLDMSEVEEKLNIKL